MVDSDDWRVTISVNDPFSSLPGMVEDIRRRTGRAVDIGADDRQIFLYGDNETAARDAEQIARAVLAQHGIAAESALHRWHPIEEQWENPDIAMPQTEAERQAERQRREDADQAERQRLEDVPVRTRAWELLKFLGRRGRPPS